MHACMHAYIHAYIQIHTDIHTYIHTHIDRYACDVMYACFNTYVPHINTHRHVHTRKHNAYMHVYTHTYNCRALRRNASVRQHNRQYRCRSSLSRDAVGETAAHAIGTPGFRYDRRARDTPSSRFPPKTKRHKSIAISKTS